MKHLPFIALGLCLFVAGCSEQPEEQAVAKQAEPPHPGQAIWEGTCKVCHGTGLAGAPIIGNTDAWAKRIARGKESLYGHALNGWGDMPARGGNPELSDEQVKLAVDYMVSKAE